MTTFVVFPGRIFRVPPERDFGLFDAISRREDGIAHEIMIFFLGWQTLLNETSTPGW